jgi:hypothetical protein
MAIGAYRTLGFTPHLPLLWHSMVESWPMTIAVGFKCNDGVVLAADSEICLGPGGRKYEPQFFEIGVNGSVYMLCAGNVDRNAELTSALRRAIRGKAGCQLRESIEAVCRSIWTTGSADLAECEAKFGDLLITLDAGDGLQLFRAGNRHFAQVKTYSVLGVEAAKTKPIFARFYNKSLDSASAAYMGIYALSQIKGTVPGCGGQTHVWKIADSIFHRQYLSKAQIQRTEKAYRRFDAELAHILFKFPDPLLTKTQFQNRASRFNAAINRLRPALVAKEESEKGNSSRLPADRRPALIPPESVLPFEIPPTREDFPAERRVAGRGDAFVNSTRFAHHEQTVVEIGGLNKVPASR